MLLALSDESRSFSDGHKSALEHEPPRERYVIQSNDQDPETEKARGRPLLRRAIFHLPVAIKFTVGSNGHSETRMKCHMSCV